MDEVTSDRKRENPSVFISYAKHDSVVALDIATRLQAAGIRVWWDAQLDHGQSWAGAIEERLRSADYVVVLVTRAALEPQWVMKEATRAFRDYNDRAITVLPVLLEDVEMPLSFQGIQFLDLRHKPEGAADAVVSRLSSNLSIDFGGFNSQAFEDLIADILNDLGFSIEREPLVRGRQWDFRATVPVRDPFGATVIENWLVEAKHQSRGRVSVPTIREFIVQAENAYSHGNTKVALITSGQITSAGRELLSSVPLRIVEGVELKRILLTRHHLVLKHISQRLK